jgi:DNA-binding response OmpR family regulator
MTILIVEDEPGIVAPLRFLMEQQGHGVRVVGDGAAVLPAVDEAAPALVLLDVMLPSRDGFALCADLRARHPGLKIIMLTAKGRPEDVARGMDAGADDYIVKPFAIDEVVAKVTRHLADLAPEEAPSPDAPSDDAPSDDAPLDAPSDDAPLDDA